VDDIDRGFGHGLLITAWAALGRILPARPDCTHGVAVFFFELHEGDNEVYSDVLVASESEWEPEEFFELVQTIRRRIQDQYHHDTLSEAIAIELERDHGFIYISDDRLAAAVNVSTEESENFLADLEVDLADAEEDDDDDDGDDQEEVDYRAILAEFDPGSDRLN
jgi:hypothetical protein